MPAETDLPEALAACAELVLRTPDPWEKARRSRAAAEKWRSDPNMPVGVARPPLRPSRPTRPELLDPRRMPKRRGGSPAGRAALLHAISHIELNAVDLHWDIVARFTETKLPKGFYDDWVRAADEESKHFLLLSYCLARHDMRYGDLPAHAGMWRSAEATKDDLLARLAVVPMVLEARGLDVTPGMIEMFRSVDDAETVSALETIYAEEVGHVAYGSKWFHFLCGRADADPKPVFHDLVRRYFGGSLKPPFNEEKRAEAGLPLDFYWPLVEHDAR
ncbi:MAG: ferritin-like domain-containing protein [Pseudomonadota bacterium]